MLYPSIAVIAAPATFFKIAINSIVCEEETYLLELVRYIHLNPLRAGLVDNLEVLDKYPWSGHAVLMGNRELEEQETTDVISRFGRTVVTSRAAYRKFIADGVAIGKRDDLVGGGLKRSRRRSAETEERGAFDERILGSGTFVDMLQQHEILRGKIPVHVTLPELISRVATALNLTAIVLAFLARPERLPKRGVSWFFWQFMNWVTKGLRSEKSFILPRRGLVSPCDEGTL